MGPLGVQELSLCVATAVLCLCLICLYFRLKSSDTRISCYAVVNPSSDRLTKCFGFRSLFLVPTKWCSASITNSSTCAGRILSSHPSMEGTLHKQTSFFLQVRKTSAAYVIALYSIRICIERHCMGRRSEGVGKPSRCWWKPSALVRFCPSSQLSGCILTRGFSLCLLFLRPHCQVFPEKEWV